MATYTSINFEHKEAAPLARLQSIHFDLSSAIELCEYFEQQFQNGYPPSEIIDAFSTAILVRYSRAFVKGVRQGLGSDDMVCLTDEQRANHERLRSFRDKHIAHSVNAFEDTKIQAHYCAERVDDEGITNISAAHYRVVGLSHKDIADIVDLCKALLVYIDAMMEKEKNKLLTIVRSIPLEDVLSFPQEPLLVPDHKKINKDRKKR